MMEEFSRYLTAGGGLEEGGVMGVGAMEEGVTAVAEGVSELGEGFRGYDWV